MLCNLQDSLKRIPRGESGAGKTENTKKVIQYLAAVATSDTARAGSRPRGFSNLSDQILRANPILEAFGNAQTMRNNNSSRFGKFIRIQFTRSGQIVGAFIDWYLLEKSRVIRPGARERSYHIFYQLLHALDEKTKAGLFLSGKEVEDFEYLRHGNADIPGVSDEEEWQALAEAFEVMGFSEEERRSILRTVAAILHIGNIRVSKEGTRSEQAFLDSEALQQADIACKLLGISVQPFVEAILHPRVKAGREWVTKAQNPEQARLSLDALAKGIYERSFGDLVDRINARLNRASASMDDTKFIGVLDIAGFEIFEENSFEQLCINYTNEKLQQFFNHHMFVLEQEEYAREQIEWKFIDFGRDLQPAIDLIELSNPIGIFSCLDEDSVMPKATDKSFTEKLHSLWERKTPKYRRSLLTQGFMLTHYAAEVEYSTEGWLEKNKDPLQDNVTRLLASSSEKHMAHLFADCLDTEEDVANPRNRVKKGLFRTVAQRHKEQLAGLMSQLHSTHPHFVRCILPNHNKRAKQFNASLVLDQLRCNGVLEGIRIARTGFPNRLPFAEFRSRYEVVCRSMPNGHLEDRAAAKIILDKLNLDSSLYRVGLTKVFFRAGVLAELEEQRDKLIRDIICRFQAIARGFNERRAVNKRLYRAEAARIIKTNFQVYLDLQNNPWWRLFVRMKPLLGATRQSAELKKRDDALKLLEIKMCEEAANKQRLEEERTRAENEISRIQQTLESERALALDKDEIFKRLQQRELELSDKLAGALDDQESLEEEMDMIVSAKKQAEQRLNTLRTELEQAGSMIIGLEENKRGLVFERDDLHTRLSNLERAMTTASRTEEQLQQHNRKLTSVVEVKERKIQVLEDQVVKIDQDLEVKYVMATKELTTIKQQMEQKVKEIQSVRQQLADVSSTSTDYEDKLRMRDSELLVLKQEAKRFESDRRAFSDEAQRLNSRHDDLQKRVREVQAELEATKSSKSRLEREVADATKLLQDHVEEDEQSAQNRQMLETQVRETKEQLFRIQRDLSRECQSRDDVKLLGEHKLSMLQREYDSLNQSKIIIEKELYVQQDVLRRATELRATAERERREHQTELRALRQRFLSLQEAKLEADIQAEQSVAQMTKEHQAGTEEQLAAKDDIIEEREFDIQRVTQELERFKQFIADSDTFRSSNDEHKDRLERELVTTKGRLLASENDNRALLTKVQQKNLDIARTNSRSGDANRTRLTQLQADRTKQEEENRKLVRQLDEAKITITSLEQYKQKLQLNVEDLNHEIGREHKISRAAEKASSTTSLQLAEANRKLESERHLRSQAQNDNRGLNIRLDETTKELSECRKQLAGLRKAVELETAKDDHWADGATKDISRVVDLVRKLEESEHNARVAVDRYTRAEAQLEHLQVRHEDQIHQMDARHAKSKRNLLEELDGNQVNRRSSPQAVRSNSDTIKADNGFSTPVRRHISGTASESARSDRTIDSQSFNNKMDLISELELTQNQLQMSEMQNRHLQDQLRRSPFKAPQEDTPSLKRVQKLERVNSRLHGALDDSNKKIYGLEQSLRNGQLTLKEVRTKSHEELYEVLNSQEQSRRSMLQVHNVAISDLVDAKSIFDELKQAKTSVDVDLRDARSELQDLKYERELEEASQAQLLQEFSELQIKLDTETSKVLDLTSSLNLYKNRADEYYNKLEQAEIAIMKASRAERFAKSQGQEAEDTCATIISERKQVDSMVEDLQRQLQSYEARVEDMASDLDGAMLAKKRLQNELDDYRSQRATEIEDKDMSMEQTRRKYQGELSIMSSELENERGTTVAVRQENGRLREELEDLRSKWDDEVLNNSTWAKEKSRLELMLENLSQSRDEADNAHHEAQSKIVALLSQVRALRTSMDDAIADRDMLLKEKKTLEARLGEAGDRLQQLTRSESPSMRMAASSDQEVLQLKAKLAEQEDIATVAVGKMRRSDALAQDMQHEVTSERESNVKLHKEKANLDKMVKDLQLRLVDLETREYSTNGHQTTRFLHGRIQEVGRSP